MDSFEAAAIHHGPGAGLAVRYLRTDSDTGGPYRSFVEWISERGARMARRDERAYREYVSEEQRRQPGVPDALWRVGVEEGCPAREALHK
jgi:hypothetical protein